MQKFTFDGPNKLFIVKSGVTSIDVTVDLYSDWKEELLIGDNMKYLPALRTVGGDPSEGTDRLGKTFFLINGWRIKPAEENSDLTLDNGNLFVDNSFGGSGSRAFVNTSGDFNTFVQFKNTNLRDEVDTTSSAQFVNALMTSTFEGTVQFQDMLSWLLSMAAGRIVEDTDGVWDFYAQDNTTVLYTLRKRDTGTSSGKPERERLFPT